MRNRRFHRWTATLLFFPLLATAQRYDEAAAPDHAAMVRSVRQTVARLLDAIDAGDAPALRALIHVERRFSSIARGQGLDALVQCVAAQRAMEAAARKQFGDAAVAVLGADMQFSAAERKAMTEGPVEFQDFQAMIVLGPSVAPLELRWSRRDGVWRVVLRTIETLQDDSSRNPEQGSQMRIDRMNHAAAALRRVTEQIRNGEFKTPADARHALDAVLNDSKVARR
jgi:hypothetical protein